MLKGQVGAEADTDSRTFLKTISHARGAGRLGATLGATRMNNLGMIRTRLDNRERRARGHELI